MKRTITAARNRFKFRLTRYVVIYLRVSTEEQARDAHGLESQEAACRAFCRERGWIVLKVFSDAGVSGWEYVDRPQFLAMLKEIRSNPDVNLVFFDYSRFSRDTKRALQSFDDLDRLGVFSVSVCNPNIDCRTAGGRTARRDELSRAEDFSDQHSEKQQLRMKLALESGRWIAWAPLGYENVRTGTKGEPNIRPVEPAAGLVRQSFELMAAGTACRSVANHD